MRFYVYFDTDHRRYYAIRYQQEEDYCTRFMGVLDIDFPEGHTLAKDKNGNDIVTLPTGERIPLNEIDVEEESMTLYWEDCETEKRIYFRCADS